MNYNHQQTSSGTLSETMVLQMELQKGRKERRQVCGMAVSTFFLVLVVTILFLGLGLGLGLGFGLKKSSNSTAAGNGNGNGAAAGGGGGVTTQTLQATVSSTSPPSSSSPSSSSSSLTSQITTTLSNAPQPTSGPPGVAGNCLSGSYNYNPSRILYGTGYSDTAVIAPSVNVDQYDWIVVYNQANFGPSTNGGLEMSLIYAGPNSAATGTTVSSTRYALYGKFTVVMKVINAPGAITDFITLSDVGDEIDYEICGNPVIPQTNVFFESVGKTQAEMEYFTHYTSLNGFDESITRTYEIDWKHDSIIWSIDGNPVRTMLKNESISKLNPSGPAWFPTTPSLLQFGIWDASFASNPNTTKWAGGAIQWPSTAVPGSTKFTATFDNIQVQCYDLEDRPVSSWP